MGRCKERSMAELLDLALPLAAPRRTPILEGNARMQGPLCETDPMEIGSEFQKACQNCRNPLEGTHVQTCITCSKGYHAVCLEPSEDPNIQHRVLCFSCLTSADHVAEANEACDMKVTDDCPLGTEEMNIAYAKEDDICVARSESAVQQGEKNAVAIDNIESDELSLPESRRKAVSVQLSGLKPSTRRKRLTHNPEDAGPSSQAGITNTATDGDDLDRKIKKLKTKSTFESKIILSEGKSLYGNAELSSNDSFVTHETFLAELGGELNSKEAPYEFIKTKTDTMTRSSDIPDVFQQDDAICNKVVREILIDIIESSFLRACKKETISEETGISLHFSARKEKPVESAFEDAKDDELAKTEKGNWFIDLIEIPCEQPKGAPKHSERVEIVDVVEDYPKTTSCMEVHVPLLTTVEKTACSEGTRLDEKLIIGSKHKIASASQREKEDITLPNELSNINKVEQLMEEQNAKHVSNVETTSQNDAEMVHSMEMQNFHSLLQESIADKADCILLSCHDSTFQTPSAIVAQSLTSLDDINAPSKISEDQILVGKKTETGHGSQDLIDSSLPQNVVLHANESRLHVELLDCSLIDASAATQCSFPNIISSNVLITEVSSVPVSTPIMLDKNFEEVQHSADVTLDQFSGHSICSEGLLLRENTDLENSLVVSPKDCLPMQKPISELLGCSGGQDVVVETANSVTNPLACLQQTTLLSEELITGNGVSIEDDVKVCDICGDLGYEVMLVVCTECNESAEHVYCRKTLLHPVPEGNWFCEGCKIKQNTNCLRQSDTHTIHPSLAVSFSVSGKKKQASFGNARLRLTARLEKRKLVLDRRKVLKGSPSTEIPCKRQVENIIQAPVIKRQTEDLGPGPTPKKQLIETPGTSQVGSTFRPSLSREGSFKNPEFGKVKFISPSELTSFTVTVPGNLPSQRTNPGRYGHYPNKSKSGFSSSSMTDSMFGSGHTHKPINSSSSNAMISNSTPVMLPSMKNSLPKGGETVINTLKSVSGGTKVNSKSLKEGADTAIQTKESFSEGQLIGGNTRVLTKVNSFKSMKRPGCGLESEQKPLPDNLWIPRPEIMRPANADNIFRSDEAKVDSCYSTGPMISTTELKGKSSPCAVNNISNIVQIIASSGGSADFKANSSSVVSTTAVCTLQTLTPLNSVAVATEKVSTSICLSNAPENSNPILPNSCAEDLDICQLKNTSLSKAPSMENVPFLGEQGSEICEKRENTVLIEHEARTGMIVNYDYITCQQDGTLTVAVGEEGQTQILSNNCSSFVKPEASSMVKLMGPGKCEPVVEGSTKESIPQPEKSHSSQMGVESYGDGLHALLKVPTSLEHSGSQALNKLNPNYPPLREANDLSGIPSGFIAGISNDTDFVTQEAVKNSSFRPDPTVVPTSFCEKATENVQTMGNPMSLKEGTERKFIGFHPGLPCDLSYSSRFSVSNPTANWAVERPITAPYVISNNKKNYLMSSVGTPLQAATGALSLPCHLPQSAASAVSIPRPVPQRSNSQVEYLRSPVPESFYLWSGSFEVGSKENGLNLFDGVQAHPSIRAVPKVHEVARRMQSPLHLEELPRGSEHNSWPVQFQNSPPSDENIALYFFAKDKESYEKSYKPLVDHMLEHDFALRGTVEDAEILIFSSNVLPLNSQRWNKFPFLWAVFRDKRCNARTSVPCPSTSLSRQASKSFTGPIQRTPSLPSDGRREELKNNVEDSKEKFSKGLGNSDSSGELRQPLHVPLLDSEVKYKLPEYTSTVVQNSSAFMQGSLKDGFWYDKDNESPVPMKTPVECNLNISPSIKVEQPASVPPQDGEHGGFDIPPGFGPVIHKATWKKSGEESGPCIGAMTKNATRFVMLPVSTADSTQLPQKIECGQADSSRNLHTVYQPQPALVVCPSPRERPVDAIAAGHKSSRSRSRSPRRFRDIERDRRGARNYLYERGRDRDKADVGRMLYRERDWNRERRSRERVRERERQRDRERERIRERERVRERDWYRERERDREREKNRERGRERAVEKEHGKRRDPQLLERDRERESRYCRRYSPSDSRSHSPPYYRERSQSPIHLKNYSNDRYQSHHSRSYSSSPESVHVARLLHSLPRQTEIRNLSEDTHSKKKRISTGLLTDRGIGNDKVVEKRTSQENSVEVTIQHPANDSDNPSQIKEGHKVSVEHSIPITDLNMNPTKYFFNETQDLTSFPSAPCPPEEKSVHHSYLLERGTGFGQTEHDESSHAAAKVSAKQFHESKLVGIKTGWDFWHHGPAEPSSFDRFFPPEFDGGTSYMKDDSLRQVIPNLDLALGGEGLNLNTGTELPLARSLVQCQHHDDALFKSVAGCSDMADGNLDLSLAFPEKMQPSAGIDMNKPGNDEPVNTSLCLFG